ncbi:MAG TPA: AI-2E family transporter, partial [Longimicrobium sp.]|nr:AI-2E family transporter [Longimicrobium sp.]
MTAREQAQQPTRPSPFAVLTAAVFAVLLLWFVYSVAEVLLLLFIAALFALYLGAVIDYLQERHRVPRVLGVLAALVLTAVGVTAVGWLVVPPVARQTQALITALPGQIQVWMTSLRELTAQYPLLAAVLPPERLSEQLSG